MKQLPLYKEEKRNSLRLSVSKVKTFDACKKQYHFSYILKLPPKDWAHHQLGKAAHLILELFHLEYINGSTEPKHKVMAKCFQNAMEHFKISKEMKQEIYQIIDSYLKKLAEDKSTTNILAVEKNFNISIKENIILNGQIDRVQQDSDDIWHIVDYKTTKNKKYLKDDFLQLLTYAYTILLENPSIEKVRGSYILLRHNFEPITKEFSKNEILQVKSKYEQYANLIEQENTWSPTPTNLCNYCSYLDKCDEGKAFITKDIKHGQTNWS